MKRLALFLATLPAGACGSDHMSDAGAMETYYARFDDTSARAESAMMRHHDEVRVAPDLATVLRLEKAHLLEMRTDMGRVDAAAGDLGGCMMDIMGSRHEMGDLDEASGDAWREIDHHNRVMQAAGDLGAARAEEERHRDEMGGAMGRMRTHRVGMESAAGGDMMCSSSTR